MRELTEAWGSLDQQDPGCAHLTWWVQPQPVSHLSAHEVTVEITDETSGLLYRRQLPIDFEENGNGIKLTAEDLYGKPLQMVFYTAESIRRINDLMGKGPDEDKCHTHS